MKNKLVVLLLSVIFLLSTPTASICGATEIIYLGNSSASNVTINDFNANVTSGPAPLHVQFTSEVTGDAKNHLWIVSALSKNFYSRNPVTANYTLVTPGVYTASLIVSGADGHASLTKENYITVTAPNSTANFTATHKVKSPLTVNFKGSVSEGTALRYIWYFGDGKMAPDTNDTRVYKNITHVYKEQGLYPVFLTVYLKDGTTIKETKGLILTK